MIISLAIIIQCRTRVCSGATKTALDFPACHPYSIRLAKGIRKTTKNTHTTRARSHYYFIRILFSPNCSSNIPLANNPSHSPFEDDATRSEANKKSFPAQIGRSAEAKNRSSAALKKRVWDSVGHFSRFSMSISA